MKKEIGIAAAAIAVALISIIPMADAQSSYTTYTNLLGPVEGNDIMSFTQDSTGNIVITSNAVLPYRGIACSSTTGTVNGIFYPEAFANAFLGGPGVEIEPSNGIMALFKSTGSVGISARTFTSTGSTNAFETWKINFNEPILYIMMIPNNVTNGNVIVTGFKVGYSDEMGSILAVNNELSFNINASALGPIILKVKLDKTKMANNDYIVIKGTSSPSVSYYVWGGGSMIGSQATIPTVYFELGDVKYSGRSTPAIEGVEVGDLVISRNVTPRSLTQVQVISDGYFRVIMEGTYRLNTYEYIIVQTPIYDISLQHPVLNRNQIMIPAYMLFDTENTGNIGRLTCAVENIFGKADGTIWSKAEVTTTNTYAYDVPVNMQTPLPGVPMVTGSFTNIKDGLGNLINSKSTVMTSIPGLPDPVVDPTTGSDLTVPNQDLTELEVDVQSILDEFFEIETTHDEANKKNSIKISFENAGASGDCESESKLLIERISNKTSTNGSKKEFTFEHHESDVVNLNCLITVGTDRHTLKHTVLAAEPKYLELIQSVVHSDQFNWGASEFMGMGIVGLLGVMSCFVGFNREHLGSGAIVFIVGIAIMGYFSILTIVESLMAALIVLGILAVFQRGIK